MFGFVIRTLELTMFKVNKKNYKTDCNRQGLVSYF